MLIYSDSAFEFNNNFIMSTSTWEALIVSEYKMIVVKVTDLSNGMVNCHLLAWNERLIQLSILRLRLDSPLG